MADTNVYGWIRISDADGYMLTRYNASKFWPGLSDADKAAALQTAYNDLTYSLEFKFPDPADPPTVTEAQGQAQCEQALLIVLLGTGMDMRAALQEMGVISAGVVQEAFRQAAHKGTVVAPRARDMLRAYWRHGLGFIM